MSRRVRTTPPEVGLVEHFPVGDDAHVERALERLKALKVDALRTRVSWADWHAPGGKEWYDRLLPRLAAELEVVPVLERTPPSLGLRPAVTSPPRDPKTFADFLDVLITRNGDHFEWVELWSAPNDLRGWDWTLDPGWETFSTMVGAAAHWAKQRGKRTILGGMSPPDPNWLRMMAERGVLDHVDAIGVQAYPGTFDVDWDGWQATLARLRAFLDMHDDRLDIWVTETGYGTWPHREAAQVRAFMEASRTDVPRLFWNGLFDLAPDRRGPSGRGNDPRDHHLGMRTPDGRPKLLDRLWRRSGGPRLDDVEWIVSEERNHPDGMPVVVTGGAGFIGANIVHRLLRARRPVLILDDLSRAGVLDNLAWLRDQHGPSVRIIAADVRDPAAVRRAVDHASGVIHLAAQVAVTDSLVRPLHDFRVNAEGTMNLLEAIRTRDDPPPLVFASTNKVYGPLDRFPLREGRRRVMPVDAVLARTGFDEKVPLDLESPYGCSKGAADQYVLDHARSYGLPAIVFRMSCIYGPLQHGNEDQGWVAHFARAALNGDPVTIYGDGRQVRDILFVDDVVDAFLRGLDRAERLAGRAFNIGGGPDRTLSLLELLDRLNDRGLRMSVDTAPPRIGDQRYYVSDPRAFTRATGWRPRVEVAEGLERLLDWLKGRQATPTATAPRLETPPAGRMA